jgi:hypothetical protein
VNDAAKALAHAWRLREPTSGERDPRCAPKKRKQTQAAEQSAKETQGHRRVPRQGSRPRHQEQSTARGAGRGGLGGGKCWRSERCAWLDGGPRRVISNHPVKNQS